MRAKRLMDKTVEEKSVNLILEQASKNNLTISNIRSIADKAISYLEANAVLEVEVEDSIGVKSSTSK
jgi:hypothetical protein